MVAVAGCAGCGASGGVKLVAASRPDEALVAAVPDPFDAAARQAPNTFVGKIGRAGWAYVAVVTHGDRALIYLCDGRASEWFGAPIRDGRLLVRSFNGTVLDARVQAGRVRRTVQPRGQPAGGFVALAPKGSGIGLFQSADPAVPNHVRRWIVLPDGVRGVSDPPAADKGAGTGTATKNGTAALSTAAESTAANPSAAQPPTSTGPSAAVTSTSSPPPPAQDMAAGSGTARKTGTTRRR